MCHLKSRKTLLIIYLVVFSSAFQGCVNLQKNISADLSTQCVYLRMAQAWNPERIEVIAAIVDPERSSGRGPLRAVLFDEAMYKEAQLQKKMWITSDVVRALSLDQSTDLSGHFFLPKAQLLLDGLKSEVELDLFVLSETPRSLLSQDVDLILPLETVLREQVSIDKVKTIALQTGGYVPLNIRAECALAEHAEDYRERFKNEWSPRSAYPEGVIGWRVDRRDGVVIRWLLPEIDLPKDLWLIVNLNPTDDEEWPLGLWVAPKKRFSVSFDRSLRSTLTSPSTKRSLPFCSQQAPCPIYLKDVVKRIERCASDLCTYRPRLNLKSNPLSAVSSALEDE